MSNEEDQPNNVVSLRPAPFEPGSIIDEVSGPMTDLSRLLITVELLNQRVHILERALAGIVAFTTIEQRYAVARLVDQAEASYKPAITGWPAVQNWKAPQIAEVVKFYSALFRS